MKAYKAKWILTSTGEVLENKAMIVDEGKIVDIINFGALKDFEQKYIKDLGNSVITAGFVNLFAQLQYSNIGRTNPKSFKNKVKKAFKVFIKNYIFAGVSKKNYSHKWANILCEYFSLAREEKIQSFKDGLNKSIACGTTCIAQVSKDTKFFEIVNKSPIKTYLFFEIYADSSDKSKQKFKIIRDRIENLILQKSENTFIGVAPHSLAGVHKKLWEVLSKYCRKNSILMMTRFAESQDEIEWLEHGFSDIDLLHKFMGFRKILPYKKGLDPVEYLNTLKVLSKKVIVANANYLDDNELKALAETDVKFVYMPKYNKNVCGKSQDFSKIVEIFGKKVGFGLENFGQNNNYNLLKEAALANDAGLNLVELLNYITIYPAKILRLDHAIGSIEAGKDADFNVFKLEDGEDYNAILDKARPNFVYVKGKKIIKNDQVRYTL